ncbi:histidine phosphatase family protein [Proteiniclasticum sp. C24MP]|uniref:histidine phosphatase family protein n=1 Tax=Proteiniclasticum sp. C24MP TaxID=3374101 RepID=UPI003754D4F7
MLFVRHGESEANVLELMYGSSDYRLTENGKEQARKAGKMIEKMGFTPDALFVSSLSRTHETLENMGYSLSNAISDQRLDERHLGDLEGVEYHMLHKENPDLFVEWNEDWLHYKPGGGESHFAFEKRVASFLKDLQEKYTNGERILVVCHGGTMKTIFSHVFMHGADSFFNIEIYNCSIMRLKKHRDRFVFDALYNIDDYFGEKKGAEK